MAPTSRISINFLSQDLHSDLLVQEDIVGTHVLVLAHDHHKQDMIVVVLFHLRYPPHHPHPPILPPAIPITPNLITMAAVVETMTTAMVVEEVWEEETIGITVAMIMVAMITTVAMIMAIMNFDRTIQVSHNLECQVPQCQVPHIPCQVMDTITTTLKDRGNTGHHIQLRSKMTQRRERLRLITLGVESVCCVWAFVL
jgi:hypothetical protein